MIILIPLDTHPCAFYEALQTPNQPVLILIYTSENKLIKKFNLKEIIGLCNRPECHLQVPTRATINLRYFILVFQFSKNCVMFCS